jgi:bacterial/archaeal transporter family-2 protein
MSNWLWISLVTVIGGISSLQVGVNGKLSENIGVWLATLFNCLIGALFILLVYLLTGAKKPNFGQVPYYLYLGGILGAIIVSGISKVAPIVGTSTTMVGVIVGQLIIAIILDHYGIFNKAIPFDLSRGVGIFFLLIGLKLII